MMPSGDQAAAAAGGSDPASIASARLLLKPIVAARIDQRKAYEMPREDLAREIKEIVTEIHDRGRISINLLEARDLVNMLVEDLVGPDGAAQQAQQAPPAAAAPNGNGAAAPSTQPVADPSQTAPNGAETEDRLHVAEYQDAPTAPQARSTVEEAKHVILPILMDQIDAAAAAELPRAELTRQIGEIVVEISNEHKIRLNHAEQRELVTMLINDMMGLGPLEPLLEDEAITDIMVNGPYQIYVERGGKLELSNVKFQDNQHVMNICTRIVTAIGRRVDESSPLVDARLMDGSRVNIVIPPLAIDGASISIRKFSKKSITLDIMAAQKNISVPMATVMKVAARSRLNILISGGTGSGKTTLLNAMSQLIDHGERVVTIEDAAELQLQQPHVVRLETRPANLEGQGEITMRDLVKNSLRMRPDRIILGEVRGQEAVDMLQAMNTGHEGSLATVHANRPREALTRLENMIGLAGINLPAKAVRTQIASAIDIIVQVSRMRDGVRRITSITEVVGMEDDVITTQELFKFEFEGENPDGTLKGSFKSTGLRPHFTPKAEYFGLDRTLLEAV